MCTALLYKDGASYFGRNLDVVEGYGEKIVITPRNFIFPMRCTAPLACHYAMIGMATVENGYPLYFDATNEKGVSIAGLNFPDHAFYAPFKEGKDNVAPFELIPWVLSQCADLSEVKTLLADLNPIHLDFDENFPLTPLHWLICDRKGSLVLEAMQDGLHVEENPFDILTNSPPFSFHKSNLCNYMHLNNGALKSAYSPDLPLYNYSLGMGALGLPGDFSSASRFARAFFVKEHSASCESEEATVRQFFHIMSSVSMPKGCVRTENGYEYTEYTSCCNVDDGVYYYKRYDRFEIRCVSMYAEDLNAAKLYIYSC